MKILLFQKFVHMRNKQCESFRRDGHKSKRMLGVIG